MVKPKASYSGSVRVREQVSSRACSQTKLTTIDLFSGIGGFALGLEGTGYFETIQFVEMDKFCQKVLTKNFKGVPIHEDVKTYNPPTADVVVGGFPCQGFSVAGKRKGTSDDRYLWPEMLRVIREAKPRWVIGENVRGIINIEDGMVFKQVHSDLEEEGFQTKCFVLPAASVNAPHQRYRTFFIGQSMENSRRPLQSRGIKQEENEKENKGGTTHKSERSGSTREDVVANSDNRYDRQEEEVCTRGDTSKPGSKDVEDSSSIRSQEYGHGKSSDAINSSQDVSDTDNENAQGQWQGEVRSEQEVSYVSDASWWEFEPQVGRVANGIPDRSHRLKSLGNAVVPQLIYQLGKAIGVAEGLDKK